MKKKKKISKQQGDRIKHESHFPVWLCIQPPVKQETLFYYKCFEQKTTLLSSYLEGTDWYLRFPRLTPERVVLTVSKKLPMRYSSLCPPTILICLCVFVLFCFFFFFLIFWFTSSISLFCFFFPSHRLLNFPSLCSVVPWVPVLCVTTVYLLPLPKFQEFIFNRSHTAIEGLCLGHWTTAGWVLTNRLPARISFS